MSRWPAPRWHARVFLRTIAPHPGPRIINTWWKSYSGPAALWPPAGLCRKVAFEAICAMVSPGDLRCAERESNDGDQLQGGSFPTGYHSHGRALVCSVSLKLSACRRIVGGAWGPNRPRDDPALGREIQSPVGRGIPPA